MGHWEKRDLPWWETDVIHCTFCGQMIPRDIWTSSDRLAFCDAACEELYRRYWLPRHGPKETSARTE